MADVTYVSHVKLEPAEYARPAAPDDFARFASSCRSLAISDFQACAVCRTHVSDRNLTATGCHPPVPPCPSKRTKTCKKRGFVSVSLRVCPCP